FDQPLAGLRYEITPPLLGTARADPEDPALVHLDFDGLVQGETYTLVVGEAVASSGAPLAEPIVLTLETAPPLAVAEFQPAYDWVSVTDRPVIVFSEPVRDRVATEAAVTVEP